MTSDVHAVLDRSRFLHRSGISGAIWSIAWNRAIGCRPTGLEEPGGGGGCAWWVVVVVILTGPASLQAVVTDLTGNPTHLHTARSQFRSRNIRPSSSNWFRLRLH